MTREIRPLYPFSPVPCGGKKRKFCYGLRISPDIDERVKDKADPKPIFDSKGNSVNTPASGHVVLAPLGDEHQHLGGKPFVPSDLTGLAWWFEARDLTATVLDGATVGTWDDKSGNNRHVAQGTAGNRPTLHHNSGKPYIQFLDSTKFLSSSPTSYAQGVLFGLNTGTVFIVVYHYNNTGNVVFSWNPAGNGVKTHCSFTDNNIYMDWGGTSVGVSRQSWPEPANWHTNGFRIVEFVRTPTTAEIFIDGVSQTAKAMTGTVPVQNGTYGFGGVSGTSNFRLAAGLSYLQTLSESERAKVRNYLMTQIKP